METRSPGGNVATVNGITYNIRHILSNSRSGYAKVVEGDIIISIPAYLNELESEKWLASLKNRILKKIEKNGPYFGRKRPLEFNDGETVTILGSIFRITVKETERKSSSGRLDGETVKISIPAALPEKIKRKHVAYISRMVITRAIMPCLAMHIDEINKKHFNSRIDRISLKDTSSRWGSCSAKNSINLDFKLLFAPAYVLDSVIVHELAHTKNRGHSKMFWKAVEEAMPNHREASRWLDRYGWGLGITKGMEQGQHMVQQENAQLP